MAWLIWAVSLTGSRINQKASCWGWEPRWDFLDCLKWKHPNCRQHLRTAAQTGHGKGKLCICLFAVALAAQFIYSVAATADAFANIRTSFFGGGGGGVGWISDVD